MIIKLLLSHSRGKAVLLKGTKPEFILETASKEKCTIVWLLVPWAQEILEAIESGKVNLEDYELEQWRLMHIGAQPVPQSLIKKWKSLFPNHQYDTNYGLSESIGPGCVHLGVENIHKVGAIGKPGYGWEVKIVDENRQTVEKGSVGELAVKGPGVMTCYYRDEKATNEVLAGACVMLGLNPDECVSGMYYRLPERENRPFEMFLMDLRRRYTNTKNEIERKREDALRQKRENLFAVVMSL